MTYLVCSGVTVTSNTYTLSYDPKEGRKTCVTNKKLVRKGRWYFEVKYVSGSGKDFLAVWSGTDAGNFGAFPFHPSASSLCMYAWSKDDSTYFSINENKNFEFDMNIPNFGIGKTFGIGFDVSTKMMYFRFNNEIRHYLIKTNEKYFQPYFYEGMSNAYKEDTIKASFDPKEFVYPIPEGYLPWGYKNDVSCRPNLYSSRSNIFLVSLIMIIC